MKKAMLICGFGLVAAELFAVIKEVKPNAELAARWYAESDTETARSLYSHQRHDFYSEPGGDLVDWVETEQWSEETYHWLDGSGGNGDWLFRQRNQSATMPEANNSCVGQMFWRPSLWPEVIFDSWTFNEECFEPRGPASWPVGMEHCEVSDPWNMNWGPSQIWSEPWYGLWVEGWIEQTYQRSAQTKMKLFTGGKAVPKRQNLWVVTASAAKVVNKRAVPPLTGIVPIGSTSITVGDLGKLGNDGRRYAALSDGAPVDITPTVSGVDFYTFTVDPSKHVLVHVTECTALTNPDITRTTVGVGEYVNFSFDQPINMTTPETPQWETTTGSVDPTTGEGTRFTAPSNDVPATVTVHVRDVKLDTTFSVKEPSGVDHAVVRRTVSQGVGAWGAEAYLTVFIAPTDVSFSRVEIEEVGQYAINVSGRYAVSIPPPNGAYTPEILKHTSDTFRGISCDNRWNPDAPYDMGGDHIGASMAPPQFAGDFTWPIPANWRIAGGSTHSLNGWSPQVVTVDGNGVTRITKFGIWVQRTTDDIYTTGP